MSFDDFNDELWDEFKWEAHIDEMEEKTDQLLKFISGEPNNLDGQIPRWLTILKESQNEDDAFETYLEEEFLRDDAYFPDEEDFYDDDDEDEFDDGDWIFGDYDDELDEDDDDFDDGEGWKQLSEEYAKSNYGSIYNLGLYVTAKDLAIDILKWTESVPTQHQNKEFIEFVGKCLSIGAKLAGGYGFGFDVEFIGANIAYTKKALGFANNALRLMVSLKNGSYFTKESYLGLHARLFELRNDIGIYIQELRDMFYDNI